MPEHGLLRRMMLGRYGQALDLGMWGEAACSAAL
jgi:hypothetical protein